MATRNLAQPRQTLEANLDLVEEVLRWTSRRCRLSPDDAEELRSIVFLKLVEDDYAVLRKFRGKSSLRTYLTMVVQRAALDYRNRKWGKWRPSAAARRMGATGQRLEELIARDDHTLADAIEILKVSHRVKRSREDLERLAARLPARRWRKAAPVELPRDLTARESADGALRRKEGRRLREAVEERLGSALAQLPREDRLILELRFEQGLKICQIAAALGLEARPLYRRIERCLAGLRSRLEAEGVSRQVASEAAAGF